MMNDWKDFFKSKRVTLIGLGLLGRGLGDAIFLAEHGAELIITDLRDEKTLAPSLERLKKYNPIKAQSAHGAGNISYTLGQHKLEDFRDRDFILKAAGVPLDSPYLAESRKSNVPVYMSTALFAKFAVEAGAVLVGVTGTRGKSTVTHMIHHALILAGKRAHLGGNVRGISTLALLPEVQKGDICVLELDSWQLQGFGDLQISPPVAVFTNLKQDHLNYYPTEETYFADKANIYKFQKVGDALIVGREVLGMWIEKSSPPIRPAVPRAIPADWRLNVLGEHNWDNAAFAAEALHALELSDVEIRAGLESFEPVEGRLQLIRTIDGVEIFNDNNATTPDATIAGLRALSSSPPARGGVSSLRDGVVGDSKSKIHDSRTKNIVLIMGGTDKGLDMGKLIEEIPKYCKGLVLLMESGTEKLKRIMNYELGITIEERETLKECVEEAMRLAQSGDIVLFSPAFASFGKWFKNEYDRGNQFVELIKKL